MAVLGHMPAWVAVNPERIQVATFVCVFAYPLTNAIYGNAQLATHENSEFHLSSLS